MKSNSKYTALEILKGAGFKKPESLFGKVRVRIAGIAGIVKPEHLINIQADTKSIDILVGDESKVLKFEGKEKNVVISNEAKKAIDNRKKK